jgi:hypothetical protein
VKILPRNLKSRPISAEDLVKRSSGNGQTIQRFEIEWESGTFETAVYWDEKNKPVMVVSQVWDYYRKMGAEKSWLGFPRTSGLGESGRGYGRQSFEGGVIVWRSGSNTVAVRKTVYDLIEVHNDRNQRLGYPLAEEHSIDTGKSDRIQFFEHGVVTIRDGKYEIWVHPDPIPEPKPMPDLPVVNANANGVAADNSSSTGSSVLRRFGKREEPLDVPAAPQAKVVRQQRSQQSRDGRIGPRRD